MFIINEEMYNELTKEFSSSTLEKLFDIKSVSDTYHLTVKEKLRNHLNLTLPVYDWHGFNKDSSEYLFAVSCMLSTIYSLGENYEEE